MCITGKHEYPCRKSANTAREYATKRNHQSGYVYHCPTCNCWHMSANSERRKTAQRVARERRVMMMEEA